MKIVLHFVYFWLAVVSTGCLVYMVMWLEALADMPESVNWARIKEYELTDTTVGMKTMACTGSVCEFVDLTDEEEDKE